MTGTQAPYRARSGGRPTAVVHRFRQVLVCLVLPVVAACLGDPPPDPAVAALEVIVSSRSQPEQPCLLNRTQVAAGEHEVTLVGESGPASVVFRTAAGAEVFRGAVGEGGGEQVPAGTEGPASVHLEAGTYRVECLPSRGPVSAVELRVVD